MLPILLHAGQKSQHVRHVLSILAQEAPNFVRENGDSHRVTPPAPTTAARLLWVVFLVCSTILLGVWFMRFTCLFFRICLVCSFHVPIQIGSFLFLTRHLFIPLIYTYLQLFTHIFIYVYIHAYNYVFMYICMCVYV